VAVKPWRFSLRLVRPTQYSQRNSSKTEGKIFQRPAARDGLSQAFGEFIEFLVHNFLFFICC
jgi:hypothetical protein